MSGEKLKCILGKSACYFNVKKNIDKFFIKYIVEDNDFQNYISQFANGTTIKNVSLKVMRDYPFLLPPLPAQRAIAEVLSSLDDKIDLLTRQTPRWNPWRRRISGNGLWSHLQRGQKMRGQNLN